MGLIGSIVFQGAPSSFQKDMKETNYSPKMIWLVEEFLYMNLVRNQ